MCRERRAEGDEPSAVGSCERRRASRSGAARAVRRESSERRRAKRPGASAGQKTDGSHLADLGFGMPRATSIEGEGEGFAVPPGGEGCEKHKGRIFQSAWWPRGGYLFSKKNPRARLPRAHAVGPVGGSGRGTHDRVVLVSWFRWLFASHGNSFRNRSRTNPTQGKTTSETS